MFFNQKIDFVDWGNFSKIEEDKEFWSFVNDASESHLRSMKNDRKYL